MRLDVELYERISKITMTDYEGNYPKEPDLEYVFVYGDKIEEMLRDLICEIDSLEEKIEDIKKDIEDNYKRVPVKEQIGIGDEDFR